MKTYKYLMIFSFALTFIGCAKEYCYNYSIHNISQNNIELFFYGEENSHKIIENEKQIEQSSFCDERGDKSRFEYYLTDSIQIKVNDSIRKTYYPNDMGKSIFKTEDRGSWKLVESRKNYSKFVFEITEADLQ